MTRENNVIRLALSLQLFQRVDVIDIINLWTHLDSDLFKRFCSSVYFLQNKTWHCRVLKNTVNVNAFN